MSARADGQAGGALVRCFEPCLVAVLELLDSAAAQPAEAAADAASARDALLARLDQSSLAASGRFPARVTVLARRFATAWADERLAGGAWAEREAWRAFPLQSDWGEGRTAGEWFFEALARLEPGRDGETALAALALRCLSLGFDGRMRYTPRQLLELRRTLARRFGLEARPAAFPPAVETGEADGGRRGGAWLRWLWPVAAALALAGGFLLADQSLNRRLDARMEHAASE